MNNNTKDLLSEIQELSIDGDSIIALLNGVIECANQLEAAKKDGQRQLLNNIQNGLPAIVKLLDNEVVSKLYALDEYVSIKGEIYRGETSANNQELPKGWNEYTEEQKRAWRLKAIGVSTN